MGSGRALDNLSAVAIERGDFERARELNREMLVSAAAGAALVIVATVGVLVHAPLSRVPENTIKFAVGLLLTTFGTFWAAEGAGVSWPGDELALVGLLGFLTAALTDYGWRAWWLLPLAVAALLGRSLQRATRSG